MPRMLCDIIGDALASEADMEVAGVLSSGDDDLVDATRRTNAEIVIVGLRDAKLPNAYAKLFRAQPQLRVLGLAADGRRAWLYDLRPQKRSLGELSPTDLIRAIRDSAHDNARRMLERL